MNPERLLQHFDTISEAPDAVARLRRLILDLAMRGKLVEQDAGDEPTFRFKNERKQERPLEVLAENEWPYAVPNGWQMARFGEVLSLEYGDSLPAEKRSNTGEFPVYGSNGIVGTHDVAFVEKPCIVVGRKGSAGALNLCSMPGCVITDVAYYCIPPVGIDLRFCLEMLRTLDLNILGKGVKPGLSRADAYVLPIAVPPLQEQHRIVAKVDELMALCDQLQAARDAREQQRDRLVAASLHRLTANDASDSASDSDSDDTMDLANRCVDSARFHLEHLPRLSTRHEHIKQLRQAILNLAVRGKLIAQDFRDEPVQAQLKAADGARAAMANDDRRAQAAPQQLLAGDKRWDIPSSWEWRGLADLVLFIDYRGKTPTKTKSGVRLITAKNVKKGFVNSRPEEFLSDEDYAGWMTRGLPAVGDVLFTTEAPMGNAAVVTISERFALAQRVINFRPYGAVSPEFLVLQLLSEPFQLVLDSEATGLTAKGIKAAKLKRLPIAVPPIAEQHRIVAKVDELMALCDQLEASLATTQSGRTQLLDALLHEALAEAA